MTGWDTEEVIGRNWFDVFVPHPHEELKGEFAQFLLNAPAAWHLENPILTRSGEQRIIRWSNSLLRSADGVVKGSASIGEDITERHHAEQDLLQLRRHSEVILASVGDGIC